MPRRSPEEVLAVTLTKRELTLLQKHAFPCSEDLLRTATAVQYGFEISGPARAFDSLLGWVAGEANACRERGRKRPTEDFDAIADKLEVELGL
jgi:hypothetical protein